ncbi:MAG: hypothetical protein ABSF63_11535 [Candidatus Bathyarchaeia archaeon]
MSHLLRRRLVLGIVLLLLTCFVSQTWHPAYGHFNTKAPDTDVLLQWPFGGSYAMSVDVKVLNSPRANAAIYWGHEFQFANNESGYVTLGVGGDSKVVSFGIFDAVQGNPNNSSGVCDNAIGFATAGIGSACFIFYNWNIGYNYRLRVSRISDVNGSEQWQGSVFDYSSNSTSIIGNILVSPTYGQLGTLSSTWDEYATAASCDTPFASAVFSYPYALNAAGNHAPSKAELTYGSTTCQDSNVRYLGGGAYQADVGSNVTRTTPTKTWLWTQEPVLVSQSQTSLPSQEFEIGEPVYPVAVMISTIVSPDLVQRTDH